ncbi:hypothetical protein PZ895_08045 [Mesorhizobium sp. YIM 152430]|uniref:hypothetical protein n=1 Tax=Mesorhizobium sp. YIM 152430 TaxID=3031761 RepID=UPI0023DA7F74|nr:hypothetical protein [Mesorhizobium sp. YIM 152430]MDF1599727.1 hypothetical protein [Mesorhizobium sp. YIM 152430]
MNRLLAETLTALNGLIAIAIIAAGVVIGYRLFNGSPFGVFFGGAVGVLVAALACGMIAYVALIERHLSKLAGAQRPASAPAPQTLPTGRRDPTL